VDSTDKQTGLSDKQRRAIAALLSEPTIRQAAESSKVSEATLYRWMADSQFAAALREARGRAFESMLNSLQAASGKAMETLNNVMDDEEASAAARVTAARTILEMSLRARDLIEVENRLRALELKLIGDGRI
jgi:hypothetical protein